MAAANNPRLSDAGMTANRRRASAAARRQVVMAQEALQTLQATAEPAAHQLRWIRVLQHRISHPQAALAQLAETMQPPMTKNAYAALLRRALDSSHGPVDEVPR